MNININADLNKALEVIGNGLSDTATKSFKFVYPLAVKQVFFDALIWSVLGFVMILLPLIFFKKSFELETKYDGDGSGTIIFSTILLMVGLILIVFQFSDLINPQYEAIRNIIYMVKP